MNIIEKIRLGSRLLLILLITTHVYLFSQTYNLRFEDQVSFIEEKQVDRFLRENYKGKVETAVFDKNTGTLQVVTSMALVDLFQVIKPLGLSPTCVQGDKKYFLSADGTRAEFIYIKN